jgi:hypothetical protein
MTTMGGVTVQEKTQPKEFASFTLLHKQQHDTERVDKFQYSVQVGSNGLRGSTAWLITPNDFDLLRSLLKRQHDHLKNATVDNLASPGLGQYAKHTHCPKHVNDHLLPIYILHENEEPETRQRWGRQPGDDEWMELKTVVIRADRDIQPGEEILIHYVGSGKSGDFRKVFSCVLCVYWTPGYLPLPYILYIHTYIRIYIDTHIHIYMCVCVCVCVCIVGLRCPLTASCSLCSFVCTLVSFGDSALLSSLSRISRLLPS